MRHVATVESCAGCHNPGLQSRHALGNQVSVSNVALVGTGADIVVTYNVKVDGMNRNDYTHLAGVHTWVWDPATGVAARTALTLTPAFTVVPAFNGNYTLTLPGFGATGATPAVFEIDELPAPGRQRQRAAPGHLPGPLHHRQRHGRRPAQQPGLHQLPRRNSCSRPSTPTASPLGHHGANPVGVEACVVCHDRDNAESRLVALGTRLMGYVHGIHNSHNMPGATKLDGTPLAGGIYYRNFNATPTPPAVPTGVSASSQFSIGFPGFMNNCSTCHDLGDLPTIAATPVSWARCMSCHAGPPTIVTPGGTTPEVAAGFVWAGFGAPNTGTPDVPIFAFDGVEPRRPSPPRPIAPRATRTGASPPRRWPASTTGSRPSGPGSSGTPPISRWCWAGTSSWSVTGVCKSGTNLVVTWGATYDGTPVDPCNATVATGPVFIGAHGQHRHGSGRQQHEHPEGVRAGQ